ncbi:osmosensing histidine protein kinase SLN1 [Sodiomyces alkalinus F11]|uniref:histidine kinase n=1 Tax=Sodiomyces alkalinus (strain CBS 110278 / VKM F-3762 / F11) TaxID=1314773 RepID=A0A3N2Q2W8_SODAK|nr:osmosensing histidine protein kinase SLN1 [Sodiomyces alkalinus F11]ROT41114.1 osmosensing histidine protein kinase SLN1 [Sodiomyces alkalinus F11]
MAIRVAIREQLAIVVVLAVLLGLMILSVPVWVFVNRFVNNIEGSQLALTASLKASKISAELELAQSSCLTISSRLLIQRSLYGLYTGNAAEADWEAARLDLSSAISVGFLTGVLQGRIYSRNVTGDPNGLVNVTGSHVQPIRLPHTRPDGQPAYLSHSPEGYPPQLYPNITYIDLGRPSRRRPLEPAYAAEAFPGVSVSANGGLLLGPLVVNQTYALMSVTVPIRDQFSNEWILGYITMVFSAESLFAVQESREGLGETGVVLLVGPTGPTNRFDPANPPSNHTYIPDRHVFGENPVRFILPPGPLEGQADRHSKRSSNPDSDAPDSSGYNVPFPARDFPAVLNSFADRYDTVNNASSMIATHNEQGVSVAVGFARTSTPLVNWTVIVEQAKSEVDAPTVTLRNIILGCVFGTAGLVIVLVFPLAHLSVLPIRRLKAATEKTIAPPGYDSTSDDDEDEHEHEHENENETTAGSGAISSRSQRSQKGSWAAAAVSKIFRYRAKERPPTDHDQESARRTFKIPGKVDDRKHFIIDELSELTQFFNGMSDELVKQYTSLDDKVAERTRELEISKKAAEAANESKTLFIANISHELKTPLNGILGMCAVCMEETDISRIKQSLKTLYKSGDLLLHLLEDLLSFSKNQIGQQLALEEREFRLADIRTQVLSIFDKQVREGRITLSVNFSSSEAIESDPPVERVSTDKKLPALGPNGAGRLKDLCLWGDQHRILQIIINLVSNSLKFTPPGGTVSVRIRCVGEVETTSSGGDDNSRPSSFSRDSKQLSRSRYRPGGSSAHSSSSKAGSTLGAAAKGTALSINPMEPKFAPHLTGEERSPTPPPPGAKSFMFEFEVEDTGPGIPEHLQQRVFEPFVQGDLGLSKKFGGTGLGLSICHQLAYLMGGSVSLRSTVGVGSVFTVYIPLRYVREMTSSTASSSVKSRPASVATVDGTTEIVQRTAQTPNTTKATSETKVAGVAGHQATRLVGLRQPYFPMNPTPSTPRSTQDSMAAISRAMANKSDSGKLRVLVADDNATNIEVVSKMLKLEDIYDVTIAKDGQEAFDLVKANMDNNMRFDVIFMDVQMPNLDGLQSTKLIRQMGYKAPIVALTAFSEESNVRECMESGMDEFLSKPIRRPALKQVLMKFATIPEEPESTINTSGEATSEEEEIHDARQEQGEPKQTNGVKNNSEAEGS